MSEVRTEPRRVGGWREPWSRREISTVAEFFPIEGAAGCIARLPELDKRGEAAIGQKAYMLGLKGPGTSQKTEAGMALAGERLDRAIAMYEGANGSAGASFMAIARAFGVSESAATNAILRALCVRQGFTPAQRDENGELVPEAIERIRKMMRAGFKGVRIQLELGVSAGCVRYQRRIYEKEMDAAGMALPGPGAGLRYSGARLTPSEIIQIEALLLRGWGQPRIRAKTGVSNKTVRRIRVRLVAEMQRRGECLPGHDFNGRRLCQVEHATHKTPQQRAIARGSILAGDTMAETGAKAGMSKPTVSKLRMAIKAELAAKGEVLPTSRTRPPIAPEEAAPPGPAEMPAPMMTAAPPGASPTWMAPPSVVKASAPAAPRRSATFIVRQPPPSQPEEVAPSTPSDRQANRVIVSHGRLPRPADPLAKRGTRPRSAPAPDFSPEFLERLRKVAEGKGIVEVGPITKSAPQFSGGGSSLAGI